MLWDLDLLHSVYNLWSSTGHPLITRVSIKLHRTIKILSHWFLIFQVVIHMSVIFFSWYHIIYSRSYFIYAILLMMQYSHVHEQMRIEHDFNHCFMIQFIFTSSYTEHNYTKQYHFISLCLSFNQILCSLIIYIPVTGFILQWCSTQHIWISSLQIITFHIAILWSWFIFTFLLISFLSFNYLVLFWSHMYNCFNTLFKFISFYHSCPIFWQNYIFLIIMFDFLFDCSINSKMCPWFFLRLLFHLLVVNLYHLL